MIDVRQGTPGSGKSAAAVAQAIDHLRKGGVVAANFRLTDGWADVVASQHPFSKFSSEFRYKLAASLYERFLYIDSLAAVYSINPRKLAVGLHKDKGTYSEGAGLLILDECQLIFNSRKWDKNFSWIEFFTQHRKLGWNVLMIAHSIEMIDSQIRPLAEYQSTFRNLQKVRIPLIGLPISPIPAFVVITRYAGLGAGANTIYSRNLYKLPIWAAKLYDSLYVFSAEHWLTDTLPSTCGAPPDPHSGEGGIFDNVKDWWQSLTPERKKLGSISPTCTWTQFDNIMNDHALKQISSVLNPSWPISLPR